MSRKLVKRVRRRMWGGTAEVRLYDDGSARVRVDHPTNDPEVELAMGGRVMKLVMDAYSKVGVEYRVGPITWRDDP